MEDPQQSMLRKRTNVGIEMPPSIITLDTDNSSSQDESNRYKLLLDAKKFEIKTKLLNKWFTLTSWINRSGWIRLDGLSSEKKTVYDKLVKLVTKRNLFVLVTLIVCYYTWVWIQSQERLFRPSTTIIQVLPLNTNRYVAIGGDTTPTSDRLAISTYKDDAEFKSKSPQCGLVTGNEIADGGRYIIKHNTTHTTVALIQDIIAMNNHILEIEGGVKLNFVSPTMYLHTNSIPCVCSLYTQEGPIDVDSDTTQPIVHMLNPRIVFKSDKLQKIKERMSLIESRSTTKYEKHIPECIGLEYLDYKTNTLATIHLHKTAVNRALLCLFFMNT